MFEFPDGFKPKPTDVTFAKEREDGNPGCLCSRCLLPIFRKGTGIRYREESGKFEFRYHSRCLRFDLRQPSSDWYEEWLEDSIDWETGELKP